MAVQFRKSQDHAVRMILLDPEGKSVILNVSNGEGDAFRLIVVYTPTEAGQLDFFRRLEGFPGNVSLFSSSRRLERHFGCTPGKGGTNQYERREKASEKCSVVSNRLTSTDWIFLMGQCEYGQIASDPSRSYLDRIFCKPVDNSIGRFQFKFVSYTGHNFVICMANIDRIHS